MRGFILVHEVVLVADGPIVGAMLRYNFRIIHIFQLLYYVKCLIVSTVKLCPISLQLTMGFANAAVCP